MWKQTNTEYKLRWDRRLSLKKQVSVKIGAPVSQTIKVFNGTSFEDNDVPEEIFNYHLVVNGSKPSPSNEYTKTTIIDDDVELVPYHFVNISGEKNDSRYVDPGSTSNLGDESGLKDYFESDEYVVGDATNHTILDEKSPITGDMNIIVMPRNVVIIEIEKYILRVDVNLTYVAECISKLAGIDINSILIDVEVDEEGYVVRLLIILNDTELCRFVESAVNNLLKDGNCQFGILCRNTGARILVKEQLLSLGYHNNIHNGVFILFIISMMVIMMV